MSREKQDKAATLIQSAWRARQSRTKYEIHQAPSNELTHGRTFVVGNDPKIKDLEQYAVKNGKVALVGTSGLRSLALIAELGNKESTPKLIIVDNSRIVIRFWRNLRSFAEQNQFNDKQSFMQAYEDFLSRNSDLYHQIPDDEYDHPGVEYENQNPVLFMSNLIDKYGLDYILAIVKHSSILAQSWADNKLFTSLKNIIDLNAIDKVFAYPSNIEYCVFPDKVIHVRTSTALLDPALSIETDRCPHHGIPENVFLKPGNPKPKTKIVETPVDTQNKVEKSNNQKQVPEIPNELPKINKETIDEELEYAKALSQLYSDKKSVDIRLVSHLEQLIAQVEQLKRNGKESVADLTNVLLATHKRLYNEIDAESYKDLAKTVQGKHSAGMKILGGILMAVGAAIVAVGIALTVAVGPLNALVIGAGVLTAAAGVGFFAAGTQKELSKTMNEVNDKQSSLNPK